MKSIFISGISSGIGKGLALHFAKKGVQVFGVSRRPLDFLHENIYHQQIDLLDYAEVPFVIDEFLKDKKLDLTILNAGILGKMSTMKDANLKQLKEVMETNLWSQKVLLDSLLKTTHMKTVIGISSGAAINGNIGWSGYSLSKAAFNMLIQLYAKENPSINFIALAPGLVDTPMQDYISSKVSATEFPSVARLQQAKGTPMMPAPEKFAELFEESLDKILKCESGHFIDFRDLN